MEKRKRNKIILIIFVCVVWAFLIGALGIKILEENNKCMAKPLPYSANMLEESAHKENINGIALCSCDIGNVRVYFDKDGVYSENPLLKGGNLTPWENE